MEYVDTHTAKDGFKADIYKRLSSVSGETVYAAYPHKIKPNKVSSLFGGAFFQSVEQAKEMIG